MSDDPQASSDIPLTEHEGLILAHGSAVVADGRAILFIGASGSGKSALALELMAYGATLIGDDRVCLKAAGEDIMVSPPPTITGRIEARGVGILPAATGEGRLAVVVDLDVVEAERLPHRHTTRVLGHDIARLHKVESPHFTPALWQYLRFGRAL